MMVMMAKTNRFIAEDLFENGLCLPSGSNFPGVDFPGMISCVCEKPNPQIHTNMGI